MSEIEVGEYVRTNDGRIRIFKNKINDDDIELTRPYNIVKRSVIVKHSKDVKDLIMKDDMLKIYAGFRNYIFYITEVTEQEIIDGISIIKKEHIDNNFTITGGSFTGCKFSIITKEQFEKVEYKVGG